MVPAIIEALAKHYLGNEVIEAAKKGIECATELMKKELDEFENQKKSIEDFRIALENLIKACSPDKPLIFIVDELDRCNPTYAVKVLERIKHLFSISNIVFVLSIDKKQLCHSICGFYGSDKINSEEYLKRFIDIEYNLPEPDGGRYCDFLFDTFSIGEYIASIKNGEKDCFNRLAEILFQQNHLNLRKMEKIYSHCALILYSLEKRKTKYDGNIILFLVFLRICHSDMYISITHKNYNNAQEVINAIEYLFPYSRDYINDEFILSYTIVSLLFCYFHNETNHSFGGREESVLLRKQHNNKIELNFETQKFDKDKLLEVINWYQKNAAKDILDIKKIADLIDLVQNFNYKQ